MKVKSSKYQTNSDLLFKVLFIKPAMPLDANTLTASYGVTAGPLLDAAFYVELGARAVETVERMKRWGAWPSMEYTTCRDYTKPVLRSLDLLSGLKVKSKLD